MSRYWNWRAFGRRTAGPPAQRASQYADIEQTTGRGPQVRAPCLRRFDLDVESEGFDSARQAPDGGSLLLFIEVMSARPCRAHPGRWK